MYYEIDREKQTKDANSFTSNCQDFPTHFHNCFEILYVQQGSMTVVMPKTSYSLDKGDMILIPPNTPHSFSDCKDNCSQLIFISTMFIEEIGTIFSNKTLDNLKITLSANEVEQIVLPFLNSISKDCKLAKKGYGYLLFNLFFAANPVLSSNDEVSADIAYKILRVVQKKYDKDISLSYIAKELSVCTTYVSRVFNNTMGCSFKSYITALRMEKAKNLLTTQDDSIIDIAIECGYDSQRTFNRAFKAYQNQTPGEYRRSWLSSL